MASVKRDANFVPAIQGVDTVSAVATGINALALSGTEALVTAIVDGSGNQITSFGAPSFTDNAAFTAGTTKGLPIMGFYHSTIDSVTDGSAASVAIDSKRSQFMVIRDAALNARGVNVTASNELLTYINGTNGNIGVAVNNSSATPANTNLAQVGGSAISIGQQLAAASLPVILPSATITTLTPPSNTGYALDSSLTTIDTDLKSNVTLHAGTNIIGKVTTDQTTHGTTDLVAADITKYGGNAVAAAGQNGVISVGGQQATNNNVSTNGFPLLVAGSDYGGTPKIQSLKVDSSGKIFGNTIDTVTAVTAITNALPAGTNLMGKVGIDQTTIGTTNGVTPVPSAAGATGWQFKQMGDGTVGSNWNGTKQQIVGGAATFGGYVMVFNPNTATSFIQVFNKTSANVTLGTTVPDMVIPLPGIASASATGSAANNELVHGVKFSTGLTVAITTTVGGSTAPSSNCYGCILFN